MLKNHAVAEIRRAQAMKVEAVAMEEPDPGSIHGGRGKWRKSAMRRPLRLAISALLSVVPLLAVAPVAPVSAAANPTITSFTTGNDYVQTGSWAYINANVSTPIDHSTYFVRLTDITAGKILKTCTTGTSCGLWLSTAAGRHIYSAHLDRGNGGPPPYPIVSAPPNRAINWVTTLPTLTSGRISFHTNDEDRDWDTDITVEAYKRDGSLAASGKIPRGHFDDNSDDGPYPIDAMPGVHWDDLRGGWLRITIQAHNGPEGRYRGNDTWRFNYSSQLYFSNGAYVTIGRHGVQMSDDRSYSWTINF